MYKRNSQGWLKHLDFILLDGIALQLAFILAYQLRRPVYQSNGLPYAVPEYLILGVVMAVVDIVVCIVFNTMHNVMKRGYGREFVESVRQVVLVLAIMSLYMFSTQSGDTYSRITVYLTSIFHLIFGYLTRIAWKPFIRRRGLARKNKASMILVADEKHVGRILSQPLELESFEYTGLVLTNRDAAGEMIAGLNVVANMDDAADYICREHVDEIFIFPTIYEEPDADTEKSAGGTNSVGSRVTALVDQCRQMAIPIHIELPIDDVGGKNFVEKVGGYDVLTSTVNYASPLQLAVKRLADILGGLVGSLFALIIIAVIGPKIKKESPGPILFKQTRIGLNGKKFQMYKIRSMYMDAEERKKELMEQNRVADGMMFKMDFDPRIIGNRIDENGNQVTGIGEKIRASSLDEFPQFFNVLKGDMSIVGTRPPTVDEWEKYKYHHRARLAIKPGITGMWQVSGRSEITDFEEVVKLDTQYITNWSLTLDMKIILKTFGAVFKHEGAM